MVLQGGVVIHNVRCTYLHCTGSAGVRGSSRAITSHHITGYLVVDLGYVEIVFILHVTEYLGKYRIEKYNER